jgi:DNA modification methylase
MNEPEAVSPAMEVRNVPLSEIRPYERNPRHNEHAVDAVARSISEFGFRVPIVVDEDGVILAGDTRFKAAQRLGRTEVPVHVALGLSAEKKRAFRIADNKVAEAATWDRDRLVAELADLRGLEFDLSLTGFGDDELIDLLEPNHGKADPDAVPPIPQAPTARLGDVWLLGHHRLVCGDARDARVMSQALGGEPAEIVWTDPPYNVDYAGTAGKIANDNLSAIDFAAFLRDAFSGIARVMAPGASIYVAHADSEGLAFRSAFTLAGLKLSGCLIWHKDLFSLSRSDYQWQHEPILYGWKPGAAHRWFGGRKQSTVSMYGAESRFTQRDDGKWVIELGGEVLVVDGEATFESMLPSVLRIERPRRSDEHPTMKPVALVEQTLRNSARPRDLVLDAFAGSGTTLIAAERLGMRAALVELDPRFVDVILQRWETYTGGHASRAIPR